MNTGKLGARALMPSAVGCGCMGLSATQGPMVGGQMSSEAATGRGHLPDEDRFRVMRSEDVVWKDFEPFPAGAQLSVLVGDPATPAPFVIRVRVAANVRMMPHRHGEDRIYTVISGVFYIGIGEVFDESKLTAHAPGTVVVLPAGTPHFHWARSGEICDAGECGRTTGVRVRQFGR